KVGDTVTIRKPVKFSVSDGATRVNQDVTETSTSIVINKRKHISWNFTTSDLTLKIEEYSERYIEPALNSLADQVDLDLLALASDVYNAVGTPGTTPNSFSVLGDAAVKLDNEAVPSDMRSTVLNPAANWAMADALKGTLNADMSKDFIRKGKLGHVAGADVYGVQNISRITTGPKGGTPLVNGAAQTGSSLITDGWTAAVAQRVAVGDVFTIANVFAVNPVNKASTGQLRQFVVATGSTLNSDAGGNLTITISPAITTTGPYQSVTVGAADNAALTFLGTASTAYPANLTFHRDAFALVMVPLELPRGAAFKARAQADGMSVRVINDYDIDADTDIIRLDILYGVKTLYAELACRIFG
ncbi:MAG: P22 phage major capsid protein family protein, partial [Gammaproteobacteria bacterium]